MLHSVVMAGGSGTRFWPLSRRARPKHLLALAGTETLIQQTVARIAPLVSPDRTWVITGVDHANEVRTQLPELPERCIVAEPCRRDTAACIGLAATIITAQDPDATMVVMPADHVIEPSQAFRTDVAVAAELVQGDETRLITFGINPDRPAVGYGYIQRGKQHASLDANVYRVQSFREKPTLEVAEQYVTSGQFFWNSGIFVWKGRTILRELEEHRPELSRRLSRIAEALSGPAPQRAIEREYQDIERVSIDYAVMERARNLLVVQASFGWDDVGSWGAIQRLNGTNAEGNTILGNHCGIDTRACIVVGDADHLIATIGLEGLIIVQAGNATLIADKGNEEAVKRIVEMAQEQGMEGYL